MLRSVLGIFKAVDERNAGYSNTLTQLRLLFKKGRKVRAILLSAGPSQEGLLVAELESRLEAKKLELQVLLGPAAKKFTLRTEASRLRDSVETLDREKREVGMLSEDVGYLAAYCKKIRADPKTLRKWNMELADETRESIAQAVVESALLEAITKELVSLKAKLSVSPAESGNSHWSTHRVAKGASKV